MFFSVQQDSGFKQLFGALRLVSRARIIVAVYLKLANYAWKRILCLVELRHWNIILRGCREEGTNCRSRELSNQQWHFYCTKPSAPFSGQR
eukprot:scaffold2747_cov104-Cylindrotheca_fusiformis.AAC.3